MKKSVELLLKVSDDFERIPYFTDEHIFVDMDGTVAEYQSLPVDEHNDINFVEYEVFKYSSPVTPIIDKLHKLYKEG